MGHFGTTLDMGIETAAAHLATGDVCAAHCPCAEWLLITAAIWAEKVYMVLWRAFGRAQLVSITTSEHTVSLPLCLALVCSKIPQGTPTCQFSRRGSTRIQEKARKSR